MIIERKSRGTGITAVAASEKHLLIRRRRWRGDNVCIMDAETHKERMKEGGLRTGGAIVRCVNHSE